LAGVHRDVVRASRWRNTHARVHPPIRGVTVKYVRDDCVLAAVALLAAAGVVVGVASRTPPPAKSAAEHTVPQDAMGKPNLDLSGDKRTGKASFYAKKFTGRKMADGTPMDPNADNAASKTLPLGTTATVTNVETGQSATVTIQDRGPYVKGRIIDLSPATAHAIGLSRHDGIATVVVAPIEVPLPDGGMKQGASASRD
jgi:rare lipoprotein A